MKRLLSWLLPFAMTACGAAKHPALPAPPRAPLTAPRVLPGDLDASLLLGDTPLKAQKLGAGPLSIVQSGEAVEGERLGAFVDVPVDVCLLAYARGSSSIEDLDVLAFDDEGDPVAVDNAPDAKPTLLMCPPHPARVYVTAHVANGEGLVGVAVHYVAREQAGDIGRALGARGAFAEAPRPADAWPGLEDVVRTHRDALGGRWETFARVAVTLDERTPTVVAFPMEADQCVDAVLVPDEQVVLLEAEVVDAEGRVMARAREGGAVRAITICSPMTFAGSLVVRPHRGTGLAAIVLGKAPTSVTRDLSTRPEVAWAPLSMPLDAAKSDVDAKLAKAGYAAPTMSTKGQLAPGRRTSLPLELAAQGCTRIDVTAGAPLALIDARVWDDKSQLVTSGDGAWGATLFACARGKTRIDLETRGRPGPFVIAQRAEKWRDPSFAAHPLAAARMLSRAAEGPAHILEGAPSSARAVVLDAAKLVVWEETVAPNQCVRVAVGAEGEGTGLELRLFDGATNTELDRSHAAHDAGARACASNASRTIRAGLRATSGRLDAVVGVRLQ